MPRRRLALGLLVGALLAAPAGAAQAASPPSVVTSILPVHALAVAVMAGAGEPVLLLRGGASPHAYQLKPSEARALQGADLVIWIGPALETFLERSLASLAGGARRVTLMEAPGLRLLPAREGGVWEEHAHAADEHGEEDHAPGGQDAHIWLDPANAQAMARAIAAALAEVDPARAELYRGNLEGVLRELAVLDGELRARLASVRDRPFVVFHDAWQYLEAAYGLRAVGSITVSPERPPGARRLAELRETIRERGAVCVFSEAQAATPLVESLAQDLGIGTAQLDPVGSAIVAPGPGAYAALMRENVRVMATCLSR